MSILNTRFNRCAHEVDSKGGCPLLPTENLRAFGFPIRAQAVCRVPEPDPEVLQGRLCGAHHGLGAPGHWPLAARVRRLRA